MYAVIHFSLDMRHFITYTTTVLIHIFCYSSKIAVLGKDTENPPQGQAFRLQTMIRSAFATYLRNQLLTLPLLPTEEQVEKAQTKRRYIYCFYAIF